MTYVCASVCVCVCVGVCVCACVCVCVCMHTMITVKGNIYTLLGILAEVYPEHVVVYSERLVSMYVGALKAEVCAKRPFHKYSFCSYLLLLLFFI